MQCSKIPPSCCKGWHSRPKKAFISSPAEPQCCLQGIPGPTGTPLTLGLPGQAAGSTAGDDLLLGSPRRSKNRNSRVPNGPINQGSFPANIGRRFPRGNSFYRGGKERLWEIGTAGRASARRSLLWFLVKEPKSVRGCAHGNPPGTEVPPSPALLGLALPSPGAAALQHSEALFGQL